MAASLALRRLVSPNRLSSPLRSIGSASSAASSHFIGAGDQSREVDRLSDRTLYSHRDFSRFQDVISPFASRSLRQIMKSMDSSIASGISSNGDGRSTQNAAYFSKGLSTMVFKGELKSSEEEENGRKFSIVAAGISEEGEGKKSLRPLSPHLPIYKPQLSSTTSILNRISAMILTTTILGSYMYLKIGSVAFTYGSFYEVFFYSTKLVPIAVEISALALVYHTYAGIGHLIADFSGKLSTSKKH